MGIYTFKNAKVSELGLWLRSEGGKEEIYLDPGEARKLAEQIIAQTTRPATHQAAAPVRRSAPTTQRSAPVVQRSAVSTGLTTYKATKNALGVTGSKTFEGKSSCTDPRWQDHAKSLAKQRAKKSFDSYVDRLRREGKTWNDCSATGRHIVNGYAVKYVITADFA